MNAALARAEGTPVDEIGKRVWVFPTEVSDGCWGSHGGVRRLPDIMAYFGGAPLRALGAQRLADKRLRDAQAVFAAAAADNAAHADPAAALPAAD